MPRKKKEAPKEVKEEKKVEGAEVKVEKAPKKATVKVEAKFTAKDQDGAKIKVKFSGEGAGLEEAVNNLRNEEDDGKFPKGLVALVSVRLRKGDVDLEKSIAPAEVRRVFNEGDINHLADRFYVKGHSWG